MNDNQIWQSRNVGHVHLPKTKVAVNTVTPLQSASEKDQTVNNSEEPNSEELDNQRNDFSFDDSTTATETTSPIDIVAASEEIIAELQQRDFDEDTLETRLRLYRDLAGEEGEASTNEDMTAATDTDNSDDDDYINDMEESDTVFEDNEPQEDGQDIEVAEVVLNADGQEVPASTAFPSTAMPIVPLSLDFLDNLGRLWEEKSEAYKNLAQTKLFDGRGHPIDLPPTEDNQQLNSEDTSSSDDIVYLGMDREELAEIEEYSTKRKSTEEEEKRTTKKAKITDQQRKIEDGLKNLRRLLNLPTKSTQPKLPPAAASGSPSTLQEKRDLKFNIPKKTYGQKEQETPTKEDCFKLPMPTKDFLEKRKKKRM